MAMAVIQVKDPGIKEKKRKTRQLKSPLKIDKQFKIIL